MKKPFHIALLHAWFACVLFHASRAGASDHESVDQRANHHSTPIDPESDRFTQSGIVIDLQGKPVAGAKVWAVTRFTVPTLRRFTSTDEHGRFAVKIRQLPEGPYRWELWASKGNAGGRALRSILFTAESSQLYSQLVVLEPGVQLTGRVSAPETDQGLAGVRLFFDNGDVSVTDKKGNYRIGGLSAGNHRVVANVAGRVRKRMVFDTRLKNRTTLNIQLPQGGRIRGFVRDSDGNAITNATIIKLGSGNPLAMSGWQQSVDSNGRFIWDGAAYNTAHVFKVSAPKYQDKILRDITVRPDEFAPGFAVTLQNHHLRLQTNSHDSAEIDIQQTKDLTGRIEGSIGKPVAAADVLWIAKRDHRMVHKTSSNDAGKFKLTIPANVAGILLVMDNKHAPQFTETSKSDENVSIRLAKPEVCTGKIVTPDGQRVPNVIVMPWIKDPNAIATYAHWAPGLITRSNQVGSFTCGGLSKQTAFDFVKNGSYRVRELTLRTGGHSNHVIMPTEGAIHGRVLNSAGQPVRDFRVCVLPPVKRKQGDVLVGFPVLYTRGISFSSDDGSFVVSDLAKGAVYGLRVISKDLNEQEVERVVANEVEGTRKRPPVIVQLKP